MDQKKTGALIRALRLERGLTQRELAEQLHVSARAVSKWETARALLWYSTQKGLCCQLLCTHRHSGKPPRHHQTCQQRTKPPPAKHLQAAVFEERRSIAR